MITPAYAPTATERVLPRMALDFTTGVLDPRVSVTRALNTATCINSSGLVEVVNADLPRFDYNPTTLAPRGLLIEETRTNLLKYSEQFNDPTWTKNNASVTPDVVDSPSGVTNADALVSTGDGSVRQSISASASTAYTGSVWLRVASGSRTVNLYRTDNGTGFATTAVTVTTTWQRFTITATSSATASIVNFQVGGGNTIPNGVTIYVWGAQLEAGAFATSYIPTTTTSLTRNADVVTMTGTNFSDWYNASEGTFAIWHKLIGYSSSNMLLALTDSGATNLVQYNLVSSSSIVFLVRSSAVDQAALGTVVSSTSLNKTVGAYKINDFASASNAGVAATDVSGTIPTVDRMGIGSRLGALVYNGHIQQLSYWPQRLTTPEVRAFSK